MLVTGGTSGIGRATAIAFGAAGARVAVSGRRQAEGEETVRLVEQAGGAATFFRSNVVLESDVKAMIDAVISSFGRLDYAFNNAGIEQQAQSLPERPKKPRPHHSDQRQGRVARYEIRNSSQGASGPDLTHESLGNSPLARGRASLWDAQGDRR